MEEDVVRTVASAIARLAIGVVRLTRRLSLGQGLVIWATAWLVILEVLFPCTKILHWDGNWWEVDQAALHKIAIAYPEYAWARDGNHRKLIFALQQWTQEENVFLKEWPNLPRMLGETSLTFCIGGTLACVLGLTDGRRGHRYRAASA
jgi:hypothetical protein